MKKEIITSTANRRVKELVNLREARYRKQKKLFIIEGCRELQLALLSGINIAEIYFCPDLFGRSAEDEIIGLALRRKIPVFEVSKKVYSKIAFGSRQEGLIAVAREKKSSLSNVRLNGNALIVVVEAIEKPGNLGAMLRTADAAGVDAFIVADPLTDIYNPNVVRSSLGTLFTTRVLEATSKEVISWLKANKIKIICGCVGAKTPYASVDFRGPSAVVLGSEEKGLQSIWRDNADYQAAIPMKGKADSLNVSAAEAIFLFEALRQRNS